VLVEGYPVRSASIPKATARKVSRKVLRLIDPVVVKVGKGDITRGTTRETTLGEILWEAKDHKTLKNVFAVNFKGRQGTLRPELGDLGKTFGSPSDETKINFILIEATPTAQAILSLAGIKLSGKEKPLLVSRALAQRIRKVLNWAAEEKKSGWELQQLTCVSLMDLRNKSGDRIIEYVGWTSLPIWYAEDGRAGSLKLAKFSRSLKMDLAGDEKGALVLVPCGQR